MSTLPARVPKIADLVRQHLPQILELCADDPEEFARLQTTEYSNEALNLNWPLFATPQAIQHSDDHGRYWVETHSVHGQEVRVCSQWYVKRHLEPLLTYLLTNNLVTDASDQAALEALLPDQESVDLEAPPSTSTATGGTSGARYKQSAIGIAQNAAARSVLGRIGHEAFTQKDWLKVLREFGHRCAYCGERSALTMDHAVPVNRENLGEHRLGNLVPACSPCNSAKHNATYWAHLASDKYRGERPDEALDRIRQHADRHHYVPLTERLDAAGVTAVRDAIESLRTAIVDANDGAVVQINEVVQTGV